MLNLTLSIQFKFLVVSLDHGGYSCVILHSLRMVALPFHAPRPRLWSLCFLHPLLKCQWLV